ncbi:hypothetical protein EDD86DRAFT_250040 [Gorgonomyces haynaldii]|nr:hypothetical protein EDD86DRAFT_250040 [Gorgonomyces haynaldii]
MLTATMHSELLYCGNLVLSGLALPFVNYSNIGKTTFPVLSLIAFTMITSSLADCDHDHALDACYILRLSALIPEERNKRYIHLFYIVPVLYFGVDVAVLLSFFADIVFGIDNILTPLNSVGLHILLGYHLLYGNAKNHLGEYLQKIHNMTYAILVTMALALAAGIYATFVPNPGTSFGFYESVNLIGMLSIASDKWKAPIFQLCVIALVCQITAQLLVCIGMDLAISPVPRLKLGRKMVYAGWCLLGGLCMVLRSILIVLAFGAFVPFIDGTYQGLNFAVNPAYVLYSAVASVNGFFESLYIIMTSFVFIRHIAKNLDLPPKGLFQEMILKYGGLKFIGLVGFRFFGAAMVAKIIASGGSTDNITNTSVVHQSWAIFIIVQTAFFVTVDLMRKGSSKKMKDDSVRSQQVKQSITGN